MKAIMIGAAAAVMLGVLTCATASGQSKQQTAGAWMTAGGVGAAVVGVLLEARAENDRRDRFAEWVESVKVVHEFDNYRYLGHRIDAPEYGAADGGLSGGDVMIAAGLAAAAAGVVVVLTAPRAAVRVYGSGVRVDW